MGVADREVVKCAVALPDFFQDAEGCGKCSIIRQLINASAN
jgi:hypothetical protein